MGSEPQEVVSRALTEIDEEVRRVRASGALPPGYEQGLDRDFEVLAPRGGVAEHALRRSVALVEASSVIDPQVPVASRRPGGRLAKRVVRAGVGWYVRFFLAQLSRFAQAVARALNLVAGDMDRLREEVSALRPPLPDDVAVPDSHGERWWSSLALAALSGASGPVLYAECGSDTLLQSLRVAGVDAYGLDPSARSAQEASAAGLDVRREGLSDHLRSLPTGALGGAVLEGSVQWLGPTGCEEILSLLSSRIVAAGVLVVASATPEAWGQVAGPLVADLAPGRPLHAETWSYLLERNGFGRVEVHGAGDEPEVRADEYVVVAVRERGPR
jgi:hypothetical protein